MLELAHEDNTKNVMKSLAAPINILLVDDRADGLLTLEAVLKSEDYRLVKASSAREALSNLHQEEFAMVLLDVQMPEMDGFKMAEIMAKEDHLQDIPILFITAIDTDKSRVHQGYSVGAVDYLFKPFDAYVLQSKVAVFAELYRRKRLLKEESIFMIEQERTNHRKDLVSRERNNRHRYRSLANAIPHMLWKASATGQVHYLNQSWHEYTGLSFEESWGVGWGMAVHPEDLSALLGEWSAAQRDQKETTVECRLRRAQDQTYRGHLLRLVPEMDATEKIVGWICTWTDVHDLRRAERELQLLCTDLEKRVEERTAQLMDANQALAREVRQRKEAQEEILKISEREQKRIGQDLHDGLAQQMAGISFMCKSLHRKLERKKIPESVELLDIMDLAKKSVEQAKAMARTFYPIELERLGFRGAIEDLALNTMQVFQVRCLCWWKTNFKIQDPHIATHLFRIAQEAIHNSIKYGKASLIEILFYEKDKHFFFCIRDNGIGIHLEESQNVGSMGLKIMSYRATMFGASLELINRVGETGTVVQVRWPAPLS